MNIGLIGLGRMGTAIAYRLCKAGHTVIAYDKDEAARAAAQAIGAQIVATEQEVAQRARVIWLMVPAGEIVDAVIKVLIPKLQKGDIIIDGGNSLFSDSIRRASMLVQKEIYFLDCGTSGGLHGKELGFSLMIGGEHTIFEQLQPLWHALAASHGFVYCGPSGAGHYVKMVHNGIEYAVLQSYADGFHLLKEGHYKDLDLAAIAQAWNHGSIIRSWICELTHNVLERDQEFANVSGEIAESGTGRWTVDEAHKEGVPVPLIERALQVRQESRKCGGDYATKLVALLRQEFGGHAVKKKE